MEEGGFGGVCSQGPVEHFLEQTDVPGVFAQDLTLFLCWDEESEEHLDSTILSNSMTTRDEGKDRPKKRKASSTSDCDEEA